MPQWKPLPADLTPQGRELVVRIRALKGQAGISTTALARKTAYSKSSWERYLNGRTMPPRGAVETLARLSGAEPARLLALWETTERARDEQRRGAQDSRRLQVVEPQDAGAGGAGAARAVRLRNWWVLAAAWVLSLVAAISITAWWVSPGQPAALSGPAAVQPRGFGCDFTTRDGHLYAGHSTTTDRLVALNSASQDVVEVQCLLTRHGFTVGRIDGRFGEHTENAVKELQRAAGAVVDGKVGPQTWALLRA